ncbi:MAG: hypothetical protein LV479_01330 [Methylacidiphilales bacterium]|nr:hypothetical protein [Candidatus Methylacidiphilales bacterium]
MKAGLAILFLALAVLFCPAKASPPPLPSWDGNTQNAWWTRNPSPDSWPQAMKDLQAQMEASYAEDGANAFSNSDFQGWLGHLQWIKLGLDCSDLLADPANLKVFVAMGKDEAVSHLFVQKLDVLDVKKQALLNLLRLAQNNPDDLHEYAALGVAYALVFDQPFPHNWPHFQVKQSALPIGDLDVVKRFDFYVQANRDHKTELDLTQQSFDNLKFLVDSEVKLSEFEYAQQNRISYSEFAQAFFSIRYDESRTSSDNTAFVWPQTTYMLADIEKYGGICVDQAYYAATLGKGRGIPTLYFHGQGSDGGHAWFGYLSRSGKWELDCGRYESQNYPKGYALDPQTWEVIDDTVLTNLFKTGEKNPNYQPAQVALAWARLHEGDPSCKKILDDGRSIMPELAETWKMEAAVLETINASDDDKKGFYQDWISQFQSFTEMKVEGQRRLLNILKKEGDPEADSLQQDIVLENRSSGFDIGIQGAAATISDKISSGNWDDAKLEYEKTIRDFGDQGGGSLYYGVIEPYIESCLKNGRTDQAAEGLKFARDRMQLNNGSIIEMEFHHLEGKVSDLKRTTQSSGN